MNVVRWFLTVFHLPEKWVCDLSRGKGLIDFHDYKDSDPPEPYHFVLHKCRRCGKEFTI